MNLQEQISRIKNLMEVDWSKFDYENEHKPLEGKWSAEIDGEFYTGKVKDLVKLSTKFPTEEIDINSIPDIPHHEDPEDNLFIMKSSLDYPIILLVDNEMNIKRVLDGNHRVQKALHLGHNTIMAKLIPEDIIKQSMMGTINEGSESLKNKLLNTINKIGLFQTALSVGGLNKLVDIVGEDNLTKQNKIDYIKEVVSMNEYGFITFNEMDEEPIYLDTIDDGETIVQIETIYSTAPLISYDGEYGYRDEFGEYEHLSERVIRKLFYIVAGHYINNM